MRLILRKNMIEITVGWKRGRFKIGGDKQPNTSRLLMNEYHNLSEILDIGYETWKYPAAP